MVYVFDLDGTLCTETSGDYTTALPIKERIKKVNDLYYSGHTIKIFTARGMGRHRDEQKYAREDFEALTLNQLSEWGIEYHKLILGKESGDLYIDNKGVSDNEFFTDEDSRERLGS